MLVNNKIVFLPIVGDRHITSSISHKAAMPVAQHQNTLNALTNYIFNTTIFVAIYLAIGTFAAATAETIIYALTGNSTLAAIVVIPLVLLGLTIILAMR